MCMADYADEFYTTLSDNLPCARKKHICDECGRYIEPGEIYHKYVGILQSEKHIDTWKTCAHCVVARGWLQEQCGAWLFAGVLEDLKEHWEEERLLRSIWLGRVLIGMRNKWWRKGELMRVPEPFVLSTT